MRDRQCVQHGSDDCRVRLFTKVSNRNRLCFLNQLICHFRSLKNASLKYYVRILHCVATHDLTPKIIIRKNILA